MQTLVQIGAILGLGVIVFCATAKPYDYQWYVTERGKLKRKRVIVK